MTKTKVLLSIDDVDLARIDELADSAGMSRSAYLVAMGRQGPAGVFEAIAQLKLELEKFELDNAGPKREVARLGFEIERLRKDLDTAHARQSLSLGQQAAEHVMFERSRAELIEAVSRLRLASHVIEKLAQRSDASPAVRKLSMAAIATLEVEKFTHVPDID